MIFCFFLSSLYIFSNREQLTHSIVTNAATKGSLLLSEFCMKMAGTARTSKERATRSVRTRAGDGGGRGCFFDIDVDNEASSSCASFAFVSIANMRCRCEMLSSLSHRLVVLLPLPLADRVSPSSRRRAGEEKEKRISDLTLACSIAITSHFFFVLQERNVLSSRMPPPEAVPRWRRWRVGKEHHDSDAVDEENTHPERQSTSSASSSKRRRLLFFQQPPPQWLASAIRTLLGVFLFAAVGLWSWDPLKALLIEKEIRKAVDSGEVKNATAAPGTLRAREKVALAGKANLNAAVAVALLAAPASMGNTTAVAIQRIIGAALGGLAAAAVAILGHGAGRLLFPKTAASVTTTATTNGSSRTLALSSPFSPAVITSAVVQALCAVALGTLAVYLGQVRFFSF